MILFFSHLFHRMGMRYYYYICCRILLDMSAKNIGDFSVKCENKTYRLPYNILHNEIRYIEKYKENFNRAQVVDVTQLADLLTFETILQYNGRAHINIHNQNIVDLVNGCCSFNDKSLLANCIKFISKSISAKELNKLLENREKYKDYEELIKTMNSFCKKHIIYLINDENIYYWSRKSLKYILCLLDLHIRDENYLANQIIKYYNSQSISNKDGLDDWFNNIKSKINWKNSSVDKLLNFDDYHIDSNNRININSQVKEPNIYKSDIYWKETNENGMFSSYDIEDKNVEFVLNDERFCAIENVIKYRNDYLYKLIEENRGNINNNKIVVPLQLHMKNEIFKELMVLYGFGRVILDENNILELMSACIELEDKSFNASFADYFDLRKTTSLLNSYLLDHDKYSNFFPEVEEVVRKYVYNNIIEITNHVLSPKSMKEVLSFNLLYVIFEQTLADNIVRYINHCQNHNIIDDDNKKYFDEIIELIDWKEVQITSLDRCDYLNGKNLNNIKFKDGIIHERNNYDYENIKKEFERIKRIKFIKKMFILSGVIPFAVILGLSRVI